ncbi:uncharacterized protein BDR25DRAFT_310370 [Lindgomyces ingoldianus]|uniref:Uncharacterized protein n=1 Tax=Lindgomyces ingoldianus TaxID=673940 RepID=A0ACB6RC97_9PLEO|nr:uncharacterized protein BDR25DRAFT_310370 [Lindgomyces ingoldianus]KAF2475942.1 hypothetical protein BDR25DRAFT_310370 [Lindgomyces ingoldianus]
MMMAYHRLPPLSSKLQAEEQISETLRTPAAPSYARESIPKPSPLISKMVHEACAPLDPGPCTTPAAVSFQSTSSSAPEPILAQPVAESDPTLPIRWPSQIAQSSSTMWLLPPGSDQSSAIAQLLRTEIQSHNITREMLHATETRRLEAAQNYNRLLADTHSWATAYNNMTSALYKCLEECSRLSAENALLKTRLHCVNMQIHLLRKELLRQFSEENQVESVSVDSNSDASATSWTEAQLELEDSPSPYFLEC